MNKADADSKAKSKQESGDDSKDDSKKDPMKKLDDVLTRFLSNEPAEDESGEHPAGDKGKSH